MNEYEIWSEGFESKSGITNASLMGKAQGRTFAEACDVFFRGNSLYNSADLTHYGCKLYSDESKARAKFG